MEIFESLFKPKIDKLKERKDVEGLIKALRVKDSNVRRKAVTVLGEIGNADIRVIEALIASLNDGDPDVQKSAVVALGKMKDLKAIDALMKVLTDRDKDLNIREEWVTVLGEAHAVEALGAALKDVILYDFAAKALGMVGQDAVDPLIEGLQFWDKYDPVEYPMKYKIAKVLSKLNEEGITLSNNTKQQVEYIIARREDKRGKIERLVRSFSAGHTRDAINACDELLKFGSSACEPLISHLSDYNAHVREECAWVLGRLADPISIPHLSKLVKDPYYGVRRTMAWSLGKIGRPACVPPLLILLEDNIGSDDENKIVREAAADALEELERTLPPFNQKYGGYKAIWSGSSFDDFDFKALLIELPIVSKGTLFNLRNSYSRNFYGNIEFIYTTMKDVLRQDVHKANAFRLIECFVRPTKNSWEFNIHYVSIGIEMITPYEVVRGREDEFNFYAGVIKE